MIPKKIREAIQDNKLVFFVGAGVSKRFNFPDWKNLVKDIIEEIGNEDFNNFLPIMENEIMSPSEVLDKLKKEQTIIYRHIKEKFEVNGGNLFLHQKMLDLTGQIITTNYDNAFEKSSEYQIAPTVYGSKFNVSEINKNGNPYILKLHGSYNEPDNCIIFKDDYDRLYSEKEEHSVIQKLKTIFTERTIIFVGFGFNDPNLDLIFNQLNSSFGENVRHYVLSVPSGKDFSQYKFLETIRLSKADEIDSFIDECIDFKNKGIVDQPKGILNNSLVRNIPNIAFLSPDPLDINLKSELDKVFDCFSNFKIRILKGYFNIRTLNQIEDYDLLIIATKTFKDKVYIEDDALKSTLVSVPEIFENIPNNIIPLILITDDLITDFFDYPIINIASFKRSVINRFLFKAFRNCDLNFIEENIQVNIDAIFNGKIEKGEAEISNIYGNNLDLDIGRKCLSNIVGRIEEQALLTNRILNIRKTGKFLNVKASGGIGKTTLIRKVAYELYNRGYFTQGVNFKSCETVNSYDSFEEILISGFNLTNIIDIRNYLVENHNSRKIDSLIILDNFETVRNNLEDKELVEVISLLEFATQYSNVILTSREKITKNNEFEDIFNLTPLTTDDALELFIRDYGHVHEDEIKILRSDILEDLLNNNPLAIKLVTNSRTRFRHIEELKEQLLNSFFESTDEDYNQAYSSDVDMNIERTKSLFQSINYSFVTLHEKEKLTFELLHLFPDGISLVNFKNCFRDKSSENNINDRELRVLRDKSLVEDYNGILQLQPIIRRFAHLQFSKRSHDIRQRYCVDAYIFNCFVLDIVTKVNQSHSISVALKLFNQYKNNLLNVLNYMTDIKISSDGPVPDKKYLLNYIYDLEDFVVNEKQVKSFLHGLDDVEPLFNDIPNANHLIDVLKLKTRYYTFEFDNSYKELSMFLTVEEMEDRKLDEEEYTERRYKFIVSLIHDMEGYTLSRIKMLMRDSEIRYYLDNSFFYLGIPNNISRNKRGFYYFEYELMHNSLDIVGLENYIASLYLGEHLEIMQSTYTLSKVKEIEKKTIKKLVVTNPYTRGLKEMMLAFICREPEQTEKHFKKALKNLYHIKYYYIECLCYYVKFLKNYNMDEYFKIKEEGLELSKQFHYQYLNHLFVCLEGDNVPVYNFSYAYYPISDLEEYVNRHNEEWEFIFKQRKNE